MSNIIDVEDNKCDDHVKVNIEECYAAFLPLEVVIHIMEFLTYADRVMASQVCQLWYEASLHPKFLNREKVVIRKSDSEALSVLTNTMRPYYHFMLYNIEITSKMKEFWLKIAPDLRSLFFENCDMNKRTLIEILSACTNLESLALFNCRDLFMTGRLLDDPKEIVALSKSLCKLKELSLACNRYLSDAIFNRLVSAMPNLVTIGLERCQMSFHKGLIKKYYPEKNLENNPEFASETVFTFTNFYSIISKRAKLIKNINFSYTLVDYEALKVIAQTKDLDLEELHLVSCEQLTNVAILAVAQHQLALTVLDVSYCARVTDQALLYVCASLKQLRSLSMRNCRAITDLGVVQLKALEQLEELDLSQCEQVTGTGVQEGLCGRVNRKMRKLSMEGLNTLTSGTVVTLAHSLPELTHLNLSYCFNAVTDVSVQAIFQHQVRLQTLRLAYCEAMTDAGLTGMGMGATVDNAEIDSMVVPVNQLSEKLHISLRSKAEEEIVQDAYRKKAVQRMCEAHLSQSSSVGYSLARLRGLQKLDLRCCNKITDVSLQYAFHFLELQHLNLSQCQQITEMGLRSVGENNPSIDNLSLSRCYNITDEGIIVLTEKLHRLKHLDIKGCHQLTGVSVDAIVNNCRHLQYLDATHCNHMGDRIVALAHRLPQITLFSRAEDMTAGPVPPPPPLRR